MTTSFQHLQVGFVLSSSSGGGEESSQTININTSPEHSEVIAWRMTVQGPSADELNQDSVKHEIEAAIAHTLPGTVCYADVYSLLLLAQIFFSLTVP
jgi:hypothetical protein